MKTCKKLMALALCLVLLCALLPQIVYADDGIPVDAAHFPDDNFRAYVQEKLDGDQNGVLSEAERAITEIDCEERSIASLAGIEYFPSLKYLYCFKNQLTELDVSKNTALKILWCNSNQLTALDVSKNTALVIFDCFNNQIEALDVSQNTALKSLYCAANRLTELDVSKNTALVTFYCFDNQLTELDVSKNTALEKMNCFHNQLAALDVSKNTALDYLDCSENQLTALDVSKNTALKGLSCDFNQLTTLDVSQNTALESLSCGLNQLTALDVSKNTKLKELACAANQLTALDVSKNSALQVLACDGNQLTALDLSNNLLLELPLKQGEKTEHGDYFEYEYSQDNTWQYVSFDKTTSVRISDGTIFHCGFTDVAASDWFFNPVMWAIYRNPSITAGVASGLFGSNNDCTREQIVTFLWAANGKPEPAGTGSAFNDVASDAWYYKPVAWAVEQGITSGMGDGSFGVGRSCTRAQAMTFLWAANGKTEPESEVSPFSDVTSGDWFCNAILWAAENGVTAGIGNGLFGVNDTCTRAQIITFLYKVYGVD